MSLESDIKSLIASVGLELYDASIVSEHEETIYRINVISQEIEDGKRKAVSLEKCVELTHIISPLLDVTPPVSGDYRLEVGTAGIERKLNSLDHFKKSTGERVSLVLNDKSKVRGILKSVTGNTLHVESDEESFDIEYNDIAKAKTYFEW